MAIFEKTIRNKNFDKLLRKLEQEIPDSSWSADLEAGSDFKEGDARCSVRVFERYSMMGGNRLSLTLTLFQNGDSPIRLSAITAGGIVNDSCGMHVHVDASKHTPQSLKNVLSIMYSKEDILFAALKVNPARIDSYCQAVDEPILDDVKDLLEEILEE